MSVISKQPQRYFWLALPLAALAGIASFGSFAVAGKSSAKPSTLALTRKAKAATLVAGREAFVENKGQWDNRARFLMRGSGVNTWVTETGVVYDFYQQTGGSSQPLKRTVLKDTRSKRKGQVVRLAFENSQPGTTVGSEPTGQKVNYLGRSASAATARVFDEARLMGLYPGVDMRLYVDGSKSRYDLIVHPGANPNQIQMKFEGADRVVSRASTELELRTSVGNVNMGGLYAYQEINGQQRQVQAAFVVDPVTGKVRFNVGSYDTSKPLVLDPVVYSTLLGGQGSSDQCTDAATDGLVSAFICGSASAETFPTSVGAYDEVFVSSEGFVSKMMPDGSDVVYSTYVGGSGDDSCNGIDIDALGNAYVVGQTDSTDLATTGGAFQSANDGLLDTFVLKLNSTGTAASYLTYFGGTGNDQGFDIKVNSLNEAYIGGFTSSPDMDTASASQGALSQTYDGFVARLNATGTGLIFSTFLGGNERLAGLDFFPERVLGLDVDIDHNVYCVLQTNAPDAPTNAGVWDRTVNGIDGYVVKITPTGTREFGTYIGGNSTDRPWGLALDPTNNIYLTGDTSSFNYPKTANAYDRVYNLGADSFITKMNRTGTGLVYSSYMGATSDGGTGMYPNDVSVDDLGFAHVTGGVYHTSTQTVNIPVTANADDPTFNGPTNPLFGGDAFLFVMNESGTGVQYCSYWGGGADDFGFTAALDGARNAYVVGSTVSAISAQPAFPTTPGAFKTGWIAEVPFVASEGFLSKIKTRIPLSILSLNVAPDAVASGEQSTGTVTLTAAASSGGATVSIVNNNTSVVSHPASFLIPEAGTTGTFTIDTTPNLTTTQTVQISAIVEGDSKSDTLVVSPWLTAVTLSNDTVVGGNLVGGRINIFRPAPAGGIAVSMNSTVPSIASVPAVVTVPTGLQTQTFDVTTVGVAATQSVDITGSYAGLTRTVTLEVIPARLDSLTFVPTVVSGGTQTVGKVQLDGAAPTGGVVVAIAADNAALTVPVSVTVPQQQSSVTFACNTAVVSINTSVNVTATFAGVTKTAVVDILRATLISLALAPDVIQGGNTSVATVGLDNPAATGGATVQLTSSNSAVAPVPASVTVPSGSTNANFDIPTSLVAADTTVTISAIRGSVQIDRTLTVLRVDFSLVIDPDVVVGGQSSQGTVTLDQPAPTGGVTVSLVSSSPSVVSVPASVSVPETALSATFAIGTTPVTTTTVVTVDASFSTSNASDTITVESAGPFSLSITPGTVSGGLNATGTVTLDGVAPTGGVVVSLSSNNAAAQVPATVTVSAGASSRTFTITTSEVTSLQTATITAQANGKTATDTLDIEAANLLSIRFSPAKVRGGQVTSLIAQLDAAAPSGGATIALTSSNASIANVPGTITVPQGQLSTSVTVTTRRVSRTLSTQVTGTYNSHSVFTTLTVTR